MSENILNRIKLLMEYDTSKTLSENSLLIEQWRYQKNDKGGYTLKNGPVQGLNASDIFPNLNSNTYPKELDNNRQPISTAPIPSFQKKDYTPKQDYNQFTDPKSKWNRDRAAKVLGVASDRVVWDPNVMRTQPEYIDSKGIHRPPPVKTGGWVKMTAENVGLRGTPFGFHPSEYPEYLKRKKELDKICGSSSSKVSSSKKDNNNDYELATTASDILGSVGTFGASYPLTSGNNSTSSSKNKSECEVKYEALKNEYYHPDFPFGVTKQEFLDWSKGQKDIDNQKKKEILAVKDGIRGLYRNNDYVDAMGLPKSDYFMTFHNELVRGSENQMVSSKISQYNELSDILDAVYERNPKAIERLTQSDLDKFWEKWGTVVELIIYVVLPALLTWGASLAVSAAGLAITEGAQIVRLVTVLAEYGIPVAIGTTKWIKQGKLTGDAVVDFVFALLPIIHKGIGILQQPSAAVCESLASKFALYNTKTVTGMKKFIASLTQEEKYIFRQVVKNKENLGKHIDDALRAQIKAAGVKAESLVNAIGIKAVGDITPEYGYLLYKGIKYTLIPDITTIEMSKHIAEKYGLTHDKETKLAKDLEEFKSKNPDWFIPLLANISDVLEKNKDANWSKIITSKSYERLGGDEIMMMLGQLDMSNWLVDENGNPLEL
jgi:hypothetical protein